MSRKSFMTSTRPLRVLGEVIAAGRPRGARPNPRGNCQRCLDPFHDPRPAPTQALTSVRLHQRKPLQASLQTVSLTSVLTSNRTEHGTPPQKVRRSHEGDLISVVRRATETLRATARRCLDPRRVFHL